MANVRYYPLVLLSLFFLASESGKFVGEGRAVFQSTENEETHVEKRMISQHFPWCPTVQCKTWAPKCEGQVMYQRIPVADYVCTGCPFCADGAATTTAATTTSVFQSTGNKDTHVEKRMISQHFPWCPTVQCKTWAPKCEGQVMYQRIPVADYVCPGCPFCADGAATTTAAATTQSGSAEPK